ncbi:MAG TPA: BTAD domain-containing putative transcriptional regulator [Stellaceae bacterium]|nr:BTAD domain-containing putative transcriptional regulator [Stellaceae bacterium]
MQVISPDGEDILPTVKKTKALLAYLCISREERISRETLAGLLWDRSGETLARDHLRHALAELNQSRGSWQLERERHWVRLDAANCWIDVFENPDRPDLLDDLVDVSPAFDQWLMVERTRFEARCKFDLEAKLEELVSAAAPAESRIEAARRLLKFDNSHQRAVRSLMTALVDSGDPAEALAEYDRFQALLAASHDMRPSDQTTALYRRIRQDWQITPILDSDRLYRAEQSDPPVEEGRVADAQKAQPSIAVLPFRDLGAKSSQSYVAEGLTDDLIERLSRVPTLFVISRLSTAVYKKQERSPQEIGAELRVRYLLSGSVRVVGNRLRLTVELTDTTIGESLWVERFDRDMSDLLDVQDQLAEAVARAVAPRVRYAEIKRVRVTQPEQQGAYHLLLRAQECMHQPSQEAFEKAEGLFAQAMERGPRYAPAFAWCAYWHIMRVGQEWSPAPERDTALAEHFAKLAGECDPMDSMAIAVQGHVAAYLHKDFDRAFPFFEAALRINPNSSRAWLWDSNAHAWSGLGREAVAKIERATALSPFDPMVCAYSGGAAMAYLADGQYGKAAKAAVRCIRDNRTYTTGHKLLVIALSLDDRPEEARAAVGPLMALDPKFCVERYLARFPGSFGPLAERFREALLKAGVRDRAESKN